MNKLLLLTQFCLLIQAMEYDVLQDRCRVISLVKAFMKGPGAIISSTTRVCDTRQNPVRVTFRNYQDKNNTYQISFQEASDLLNITYQLTRKNIYNLSALCCADEHMITVLEKFYNFMHDNDIDRSVPPKVRRFKRNFESSKQRYLRNNEKCDLNILAVLEQKKFPKQLANLKQLHNYLAERAKLERKTKSEVWIYELKQILKAREQYRIAFFENKPAQLAYRPVLYPKNLLHE